MCILGGMGNCLCVYVCDHGVCVTVHITGSVCVCVCVCAHACVVCVNLSIQSACNTAQTFMDRKTWAASVQEN